MNTITVQLTEKQYTDLHYLLDIAKQEFSHREQEAMLQSLLEALSDTKAYLWTSGCGHLELEISAEVVDDIAQSGDNEAAVVRWIENHGYLRRQLEEIPNTTISAHLTECGIEDAEGKHSDELHRYLLWMACWDIHEERNQED